MINNQVKSVFNRKTYLVFLLISIITAFFSFYNLGGKSEKLIRYWGSDFIAEIYQHPYSKNKFYIQLGFLSFYLIFGNMILLIFNFKNKIWIYSIYLVVLLIFILTHISLNEASTDRNFNELGTVDMAL